MSHPSRTPFDIMAELPTLLTVMSDHAQWQMWVGLALMATSSICVLHLRFRSIASVGLVLMAYAVVDSAFNNDWLIGRDLQAMMVFIITGQLYLMVRIVWRMIRARLGYDTRRKPIEPGKVINRTHLPFIIALVGCVLYSIAFSVMVHGQEQVHEPIALETQ